MVGWRLALDNDERQRTTTTTTTEEEEEEERAGGQIGDAQSRTLLSLVKSRSLTLSPSIHGRIHAGYDGRWMNGMRWMDT